MEFVSSILLYGSLATLGADAHDLIGTVKTSSYGEYSSQRHLSEDSSYTYQFRMDLSTVLTEAFPDSSHVIDSCIRWEDGISPTNFTWYGISIQLPEDATESDNSWSYPPASHARPLKEDGRVQLYNTTDKGVARYQFTTSTDRPVIRARINDGVFWNKFTFDFTDEYVKYREQSLAQSLPCVVEDKDDGSFRTTGFVKPTVTFSLELLSRPTPAPATTTVAPTLQPSDPNSSFVIRTVFAVSVLASSVILLL